MADRTVVRQGPVVSLSLGIVLALAAMAPAPDGTGTAPPPAPTKEKGKADAPLPIEKRPYKIRAWISVDPRSRVDDRGREALIRNFKLMVGRFVGPPWDLEVAEGDGPLATLPLDDLTAKEMLPLTKGVDKGWLIRVEPADGGGFSLAGREFDAVTAKVGLLCRRPATVLTDGPRALLQLSMDIFAPVAEIGNSFGRDVTLHVQGGMLQSAEKSGQVVPVGAIFRPVRVWYVSDSMAVQRIDVIKNTYCRVESVVAGDAKCSITTNMGDPFTKKVVGRSKMVAIGLKPASIPTRLRFLTFDKQPAAGYKLSARPAPDGSPREVGSTDREGRIELPPNFSDGLVILRLIAADIEALTEFPVMPGEQVEERTLGVDPRSEAVRVESGINSLRDEIIDQIAIRKRIENRIKARIEAQNPQAWEEVKKYLDDLRALPQREAMEARLKQFETALIEGQKAADAAKQRKMIRTNQAQHLVGETRTMIDAFLVDDNLRAYEDAYQRYTAEAGGTKSTVKALPKAPVIGAGSTAGRTELAPVGSGFKVTMPGPFGSSSGKTADGVSEIRSYRYADPQRGTFTVEYWDYPTPLADQDAPKAIEAERDRVLAGLIGGKVAIEAPVSVDGRDGREFEFEVPGLNGAVATGVLMRIVVVKSRIFGISVAGAKGDLRGPSATDFLGSFKLTGAAGKPPATADAAPPTAPATQEKPKAPAKAKGSGGAAPF